MDAITAAIQYAMVTTGHAPAVTHYDNGKEFVSSAVMAAVCMTGTATQTTTHHNPEENGIDERIIRTIMDGTRCIIQQL